MMTLCYVFFWSWSSCLYCCVIDSVDQRFQYCSEPLWTSRWWWVQVNCSPQLGLLCSLLVVEMNFQQVLCWLNWISDDSWWVPGNLKRHKHNVILEFHNLISPAKCFGTNVVTCIFSCSLKQFILIEFPCLFIKYKASSYVSTWLHIPANEW